MGTHEPAAGIDCGNQEDEDGEKKGKKPLFRGGQWVLNGLPPLLDDHGLDKTVGKGVPNGLLNSIDAMVCQ